MYKAIEQQRAHIKMLDILLEAVPRGCMHTLEFAALVRKAPESERNTPVVAVEAYKVTEPTDLLLNKSFGKYSHHFIVVQISVTKPQLYARVDFQGYQPLNDQPIAQSVVLSCDHAYITRGATSFARVSNGSPGGLTLDAFASLLKIMHRRTPRYDALSRNCLWLTECILYATGRRYADHWREDSIIPSGLERYIQGVIGGSRATAEIYAKDPAARFFVDAGLHVVRGLQWLFTLPAGDSRIRGPDEEIEEILYERKKQE
ncbi:hypothetical protein B0H19DRAFT_476599 [Mycena capillaripes]|nr:hypothetical protein B0H19DRAFT_476599 [Mycena capillaripes]